MTHAVIIRFHYPINSAKFPWRFAFFESMVLPRLLTQKNQNFTIAIWCNTHHRRFFEALSPKIHTFDINPRAQGKIKKGYEGQVAKGYHVDFVSWKDVIGLPMFDIQTALDSDDIILRDDYIDKIQATFAKVETSAHMSFDTFVFDYPTLRTFLPPTEYSVDKGTAFYSLYQPNKKNYIFCYDDSHLRIGQQMKQRFFIKKGYVAYACHSLNESTKLWQNQKQVML